ncbi:MAG TPA: helix-turn-helix domain-containing protein [Syntrophorhabdaceae bacterium]
MEKICIVKRRRRDLFPVPDRMEERGERIFGLVPPSDAPMEKESRESGRVISMELTPEQSEAIGSRIDLAHGKAFVLNLERAEPERGHMVFSFRLSPFYGGRMLSPGEVCAMLRISRSSLAKLVKNRKIDSYRIGRLRRFLFEDVLHYLGHSREFQGDGTRTGPMTDGQFK